MADPVPRAVVQERYQRLVALVDDIAWSENQAQVGRVVDVLVANGEGRKDDATSRLSGRAPDNHLVHVAVDEALGVPRPGDVVTAEITYAAPHHLIADRVVSVRRTRAGDAGEQPVSTDAGPSGVLLGLPTVRA